MPSVESEKCPSAVETTLESHSVRYAAAPLSDPNYGPRKDVIDSGLLSLELANTLLDTFKVTMLPHFPFVVIAPHTTAEELRYWKPFLFIAILAASSFQNVQLQKDLREEVKQMICSRMILKGEVSFELLQGLLVYLAW